MVPNYLTIFSALLQNIYKINILLNTCLSYSYNHLLIELVLKQFISWDHSSFHHLNILTTYARKFRMLHSFFKSTFYLLTSGRDLQYVIETPYSPHLYNQCISFERKPTHTHTHIHTYKHTHMLIQTHMNTYDHRKSFNTNLFGSCWCRLNSFVLLLLSSLKSFGFNTTVSWENNSCVHIHLRYTYYYSSDIGIFQYTILNYSLFSFSENALYLYYVGVRASSIYNFCIRISVYWFSEEGVHFHLNFLVIYDME